MNHKKLYRLSTPEEKLGVSRGAEAVNVRVVADNLFACGFAPRRRWSFWILWSDTFGASAARQWFCLQTMRGRKFRIAGSNDDFAAVRTCGLDG